MSHPINISRITDWPTFPPDERMRPPAEACVRVLVEHLLEHAEFAVTQDQLRDALVIVREQHYPVYFPMGFKPKSIENVLRDGGQKGLYLKRPLPGRKDPAWCLASRPLQPLFATLEGFDDAPEVASTEGGNVDELEAAALEARARFLRAKAAQGRLGGPSAASAPEAHLPPHVNGHAALRRAPTTTEGHKRTRGRNLRRAQAQHVLGFSDADMDQVYHPMSRESRDLMLGWVEEAVPEGRENASTSGEIYRRITCATRDAQYRAVALLWAPESIRALLTVLRANPEKRIEALLPGDSDRPGGAAGRANLWFKRRASE